MSKQEISEVIHYYLDEICMWESEDKEAFRKDKKGIEQVIKNAQRLKLNEDAIMEELDKNPSILEAGDERMDAYIKNNQHKKKQYIK